MGPNYDKIVNRMVAILALKHWQRVSQSVEKTIFFGEKGYDNTDYFYLFDLSLEDFHLPRLASSWWVDIWYIKNDAFAMHGHHGTSSSDHNNDFERWNLRLWDCVFSSDVSLV